MPAETEMSHRSGARGWRASSWRGDRHGGESWTLGRVSACAPAAWGEEERSGEEQGEEEKHPVPNTTPREKHGLFIVTAERG